MIIPTRNRRDLLQLTLLSVLFQQAVNFEAIIVDDGSTDGTSEAVQRLQHPRVHLVQHETVRGVSAARNSGIAAARSDWIAFLDDDDLWAPTKLADQLRAARETARPWVYVGHVDINVKHRVTGGAPPLPPDTLVKRLPQNDVVPGGCSGVLVARKALDTAGYFDPELQPLADWDLWLRLARIGPPAWVPKPLVAYRVHGHQMSLDARRIQAEFRLLSARYGQGSWAILYRYLGWWALRVGRQREALQFFVRAWLAREPSHDWRQLLGDLTCWGRKVVERRLGMHIPESNNRRVPERHASWRLEGQAWVDAHLAASRAAGLGLEDAIAAHANSGEPTGHATGD